MMKLAAPLLALNNRYGDRLAIRVSLDHYNAALHELYRGPHGWRPVIDGLRWLAEHGFALRVAGRTCWAEPEDALRRGYGRLFKKLGISVDPFDPAALVLFPEMDGSHDVPEITEACWDLLGVRPSSMMCATSRMVVKRKGAAAPSVVSCTLLAYDQAFEMGATLGEAGGAIQLNHPHCAKFCVLGGGYVPERLGLPRLEERARSDLSERAVFHLERILERLAPGGRILELGCGAGSLTYLLGLVVAQSKSPSHIEPQRA